MKSWRNSLVSRLFASVAFVSSCQTKKSIKAAVSQTARFEVWVNGAPTTALELA